MDANLDDGQRDAICSNMDEVDGDTAGDLMKNIDCGDSFKRLQASGVSNTKKAIRHFGCPFIDSQAFVVVLPRTFLQEHKVDIFILSKSGHILQSFHQLQFL